MLMPLDGNVRFERSNPELDREIGLLRTDSGRRGWLFALRGDPGEECIDVDGYVDVLDATIDKMLGRRRDPNGS